MRKVFGYVRSNRGGDGLHFQSTRINEYAKTKGYDVEIFLDKNSGNIIGSQLQKMLNKIPSNSEIIVTNRTRISRNSYDYGLIMNTLKEKNIKVIFLDD